VTCLGPPACRTRIRSCRRPCATQRHDALPRPASGRAEVAWFCLARGAQEGLPDLWVRSAAGVEPGDHATGENDVWGSLGPYLSYLLAGNPSRLSTVPLSTELPVRSTPLKEILPQGESTVARWLRVARENKDLVAAVLTIMAAVLGAVVAL
jgi:hypothetical protein